MTVSVRIPPPLRSFTAGAEEVRASGSTVGQVVDDLERQFPGFKAKLCSPEGRVQRFVNFYVNGDDISCLRSLDTELEEGDVLLILPAIAG